MMRVHALISYDHFEVFRDAGQEGPWHTFWRSHLFGARSHGADIYIYIYNGFPVRGRPIAEGIFHWLLAMDGGRQI